MHKKSALQILAAVVLAGLAALVMTGPISGLVLDGYDFQPHFKAPLILAGIAMVARLLFAVLPMERLRPRTTELPPRPSPLKPWQMVLGFFLIFAAFASIPFWGSQYWISVLIVALIYVLLGLGLNIVVGLA